MAEEHGEDKYITCSKCKCKYLNSTFHVLKDFGYDRLERRYKTCKKCRAKKQITNIKDLSKNIPSLELQNKGLPDNVVDAIMGFHGEVHGMVPSEVRNSKLMAFDRISKYIRKDNWTLTYETSSCRGGSWGRYYIYIQVDKNIIGDVIKDEILVQYCYPTTHGLMKSSGIITGWFNDFVTIDKYKLNLNKFKYLRIEMMYKHETYRDIDD